MVELILTQADVTGDDDDGSRDGRFLRELDSAYNDFELVADCRPGVYPSNKAISWQWLRFKLPLPKDDNISITDAAIQLHWRPDIGNVNHDNPLSLRVHVVNFTGNDASIPTDASNAYSLISGSYNVLLEPAWLSYDTGLATGYVHLNGFGQELQGATLDQLNWVKDNHVLLIIEPTDYNKSLGPRHPTFYTWSYVKAHNLDEALAPKLLVYFNYSTPVPSNTDAHVEHELAITQTIGTDNGDTYPSVENTLTFEQELDYDHIQVRDVNHNLAILQEVSHSPVGVHSVEHSLVIEQFYNKIQQRDMEHTLAVHSFIPSFQTSLQAHVSNDVHFEQELDSHKAKLREIEHELLLSQDVGQQGILVRELLQTLLLEQDIAYEDTLLNPTPQQQALDVQQDISYSTVRTRGTEHELDIQQAISWTLVPGTICTRPDLVANKTYTLTPTNTFILEYPVNNPTHTVTLRAPMLSNREELHKKRIQRKSRGGELFTFWSTLWGEVKTHRYKFEGLSDTQRSDLVSFLQASIGKEIKVTDHESRVWHGIILNPNGEIVRLLRACGTAAELDIDIFEP